MTITILAVIVALTGVSDPTDPRIDAVDSGPTWDQVVEAGEGTVRVLYVPATGFAYHDEEEGLTGVSIEIMRDFATWAGEEYGISLRLDFEAEESWSEFVRRVQAGSGGVIGLGNVTITEPRREMMHFSPPYLTNVAVLITHADIPDLDDLGALQTNFADLTPLAFAGTLHETRLRALAPDADPALATSNDEIIERVARGGYFAYIDAYNYFLAAEAGLPIRRHDIGDDPGEEFGFIMPLDSDWTEPLEAFFSSGDGYRQTDRYREILVQHLGAGVTEALLP